MTRRSLIVLAALWLAAGPASAADKLTVLLDWFVNPDHAPLVIAREGGYFERHGLDVDLVAPADPSAPPRLVAAGQGDIAITYQPDLMLQLNEGVPLVRFGTLIETPLNALIVLKDGPIKQLSDLKGKRVGYSVAGIQGAYLDEMLKSVGLTSDDVTLVNVNFNLVSALLAGQIDAAIDGYRNFELIQLGTRGQARRRLLSGGARRAGVRRVDLRRQGGSSRRSAARPFPCRGRGGDDLSHQSPGRGAGDVHGGLSRPQ